MPEATTTVLVLRCNQEVCRRTDFDARAAAQHSGWPYAFGLRVCSFCAVIFVACYGCGGQATAAALLLEHVEKNHRHELTTAIALVSAASMHGAVKLDALINALSKDVAVARRERDDAGRYSIVMESAGRALALNLARIVAADPGDGSDKRPPEQLAEEYFEQARAAAIEVVL